MGDKELSKRLIQGGAKLPAKTESRSEVDFYQNILLYPDVKKGAEITQDYAFNEATEEYGHEIEEKTKFLEWLSQLCAPLEAELARLYEEKSRIPATVKSATNENGEVESTSFKGWSGRNIYLAVFCGLLMVAAMVVGASNAAIVMLASGEVVFLEAPYRAWLIGLIVPIAGASIKLPTSFIEHEVIRKRYALCVVSLTAFFLCCWTFLYAAEYQGLSSGLDWESMMEPDNKSSLLIFFQLLSEVFASASFALALESIYRIYNPDAYKSDPRSVLVSQRIADLEAVLKPYRAQKADTHACIVILEKKRENYAAEKVAAFFAEVSRRRSL